MDLLPLDDVASLTIVDVMPSSPIPAMTPGLVIDVPRHI